VRDLIRNLVKDALESGDRIGAGTSTVPTAALAAEAIRLARLAETVHRSELARRRSPAPDPPAGRAPAREPSVQESIG
jgi:hypothetical protein